VTSLTNLLRRRREGSLNPFGTIERIDSVYSPQLDNERDLLVSLPGGHASGEKRYPVIYMHDGQNLFDPATSFSGSWNVDVAMAEVTLDGLGAIVVGIPNMGAERLDEYSPFEHPQLGGGKGALYVEWLIETVKPAIDQKYFTAPDREHTGIAGSSLGGLISLYAFFRYPQTFGFAGVLSPSLWLNERKMFSFIEKAPFSPGKLYLDVGDLEGGRHVEKALRLRDMLLEKGYRLGVDLMWVEEEFGAHHESAWARRFRDALPFLLPNVVNTAEYEVPRLPGSLPTPE
jgi:predicted alpha/beta superfamily hydrolase